MCVFLRGPQKCGFPYGCALKPPRPGALKRHTKLCLPRSLNTQARGFVAIHTVWTRHWKLTVSASVWWRILSESLAPVIFRILVSESMFIPRDTGRSHLNLKSDDQMFSFERIRSTGLNLASNQNYQVVTIHCGVDIHAWCLTEPRIASHLRRCCLSVYPWVFAKKWDPFICLFWGGPTH